jgi:hypothetical protein
MNLTFEIQGDHALQKRTFNTGVQDIAIMFASNPGFAFPEMNGEQLKLASGQGSVRNAIESAFHSSKPKQKIIVKACSQRHESFCKVLNSKNQQLAIEPSVTFIT